MNIYQQNAAAFVAQYESVSAEQVHQSWLHLLPENCQGCFALDVGAGSGRDARFLALRGFDVFAVEPAAELRRQAIALSHQANTTIAKSKAKAIRWFDDALPNLALIQALRQDFSLILLSAVWMHLTRAQREVSLQTFTQLLSSGGLLVITLRHGDFSDGRVAYAVSVAEIIELITHHQLALKPILVTERVTDALGRGDIAWQTVVLKKE